MTDLFAYVRFSLLTSMQYWSCTTLVLFLASDISDLAGQHCIIDVSIHNIYQTFIMVETGTQAEGVYNTIC